jgi:gas vesicle protein
MVWIGIIIGIFLGANIGLITIALCLSAKKGDELRKGTYN